jgi:hypothetical protein
MPVNGTIKETEGRSLMICTLGWFSSVKSWKNFTKIYSMVVIQNFIKTDELFATYSSIKDKNGKVVCFLIDIMLHMNE